MDGAPVDGGGTITVTIDKPSANLQIRWGSSLVVDARVSEEPNRFFYYVKDEDRLGTFFEVDRTTLQFRFMRTLRERLKATRVKEQQTIVDACVEFAPDLVTEFVPIVQTRAPRAFKVLIRLFRLTLLLQ